jgi:OOP family OmpA-OmpF porin
MLGFAFIMLVFAFVGYQMLGSPWESPPRLELKEFAPKKENWFLEEQSKAFKAEIETAKTAANDQPETEITMQKGSETGITAEPSPVMKSDEDGEIREAENPKIDSAETQSTGLTAAQKSIIQFEHNSNELPQKAYTTLDSIVKSTQDRTDLKITVEGYTDSRGNPVYNRKLSKYRADIVKNYLIGHGVSPANIVAIGRGPENPIKSNKTFEGRKLNRRVEIRVKKIH